MPTALITGGSSGLGAEFARQLAVRGYDLVLVARDAERLETSRGTLQDRFGVSVETLVADLSTDAGDELVCARLTDAQRPVDVLVNNAGQGLYKSFGIAELADEERQLDLNVRAVLRLSHAAVRAMIGRSRGRIINVSSVAGYVPRGGNATYSASKAWVTLFSEALAVQLAGSGVTVTAICPGFVHTEFHARAHADTSRVPERMWLDARTVVARGLADAMRGKPISVPTGQYKVMVAATRLLPRPLLRKAIARRML